MEPLARLPQDKPRVPKRYVFYLDEKHGRDASIVTAPKAILTFR